jgi:hypothetical protein
MTNEFPPSHILITKILDGILFLAGLFVLAIPAVHHFSPGDIDTSVHIALGSLIAICAIFRVLVAYGSAWLDIVLFVLGTLVFLLPHFMHMKYDPHYHTVHTILGALIMLLSALSAVFTFLQLSKSRTAV